MTTQTVTFRSVKTAKKRSTVIYHVLMTIVSLLMLYPLLWMLASSFKPNNEIFATAGSLIPQTFTLEHYPNGWKGFAGISFATFFSNSLFIAGFNSVATMVSSAVVAYGFARLHFPGRGLWFTCMILTMMLPGQVMQIPRFVLFKELGWVGSYLPMTIPSLFAGGFNVFLIMQFVRGVPRDMDEAARIDGCNWYQIFLCIILPLVVPALVTIAVLTFISSWGDFMGSLLYLNDPKMYTAALALKNFVDSEGSDYGASFAMSVVSLMPVLILFCFFQKALIEGISTQGIKG